MAWDSYNLMKDQQKMPYLPGVYAVYFDKDLVYIGSTNNLRNRFSGHAFRYGYAKNIVTPWQTIPDSTVITVKYRKTKKLGEWAMREVRLINRVQPLFNSHHKGKKSK